MYCGIYPQDGDNNVARSRKPRRSRRGHQPLRTGPLPGRSNRRTLYNRASADPAGKPWSERKKMVWWDEAAGKWVGNDVPDFLPDRRPDYLPDWSKHPHVAWTPMPARCRSSWRRTATVSCSCRPG